MATRARRRTQPVDGRPRLRLIRGGEARRIGLVPFAIVLVLAVFAVAALQAYLGQEGFHMSDLERSVTAAEERYALLRAHTSGLSSPSRLAAEAAGLGMVAPGDPVFLPQPIQTAASGAPAPATVSTAKRLMLEVP